MISDIDTSNSSSVASFENDVLPADEQFNYLSPKLIPKATLQTTEPQRGVKRTKSRTKRIPLRSSSHRSLNNSMRSLESRRSTSPSASPVQRKKTRTVDHSPAVDQIKLMEQRLTQMENRLKATEDELRRTSRRLKKQRKVNEDYQEEINTLTLLHKLEKTVNRKVETIETRMALEVDDEDDESLYESDKDCLIRSSHHKSRNSITKMFRRVSLQA